MVPQALFTKCLLSMSRAEKKFCDETNLTPTLLKALLVLADAQTSEAAEAGGTMLAKKLDVTTQAGHLLVTRLHKEGLVSGTCVPVRLSATGKTKLSAYVRVLLSAWKSVMKDNAPEETAS